MLLKAQHDLWKDKRPEISDLRVFNEFQNKRIGSILSDCAEDDASHYSNEEHWQLTCMRDMVRHKESIQNEAISLMVQEFGSKEGH